MIIGLGGGAQRFPSWRLKEYPAAYGNSLELICLRTKFSVCCEVKRSGTMGFF